MGREVAEGTTVAIRRVLGRLEFSKSRLVWRLLIPHVLFFFVRLWFWKCLTPKWIDLPLVIYLVLTIISFRPCVSKVSETSVSPNAVISQEIAPTYPNQAVLAETSPALQRPYGKGLYFENQTEGRLGQSSLWPNFRVYACTGPAGQLFLLRRDLKTSESQQNLVKWHGQVSCEPNKPQHAAASCRSPFNMTILSFHSSSFLLATGVPYETNALLLAKSVNDSKWWELHQNALLCFLLLVNFVPVFTSVCIFHMS